MSRRRIALILTVLALLAAALLFRQPIESWAATQSCVSQARGHFSNISSLQDAPDFDSYMQEARLQCRASVAYRHFEEGDREQAAPAVIARYTELLERTESGWVYLPQRAQAYQALGQYEQALADYNLLLVHDPDNYDGLEGRGELYVQMGRYEQALADFTTLYRIASGDGQSPAAYLERIEARIAELEAGP